MNTALYPPQKVSPGSRPIVAPAARASSTTPSTSSGEARLSASETRERVARESERRGRLAVLALAGGVLYLLSGIVIAATVNGAPRVGVLQGLGPALRGRGNTGPSPRAAEVKYISHHAFAL